YDYIPNHPAIAKEEFPSPFRDAETARELLAAMAEGVQVLEDDAFDALISSALSEAQGEILEQWGKIVGERRRDLETDDTYRQIIRARIQVQSSEGTSDDLIGVYQTATAPSKVRMWQLHPASAHLTAYKKSLMSKPRRRRVRRIMEDATPAGVEVALTETHWSVLNDEGGTLQPGGFGRVL
ncbi:MAG: hypothetical protein ABEN55_12095, partial [Bradymonadaceae bacterium]